MTSPGSMTRWRADQPDPDHRLDSAHPALDHMLVSVLSDSLCMRLEHDGDPADLGRAVAHLEIHTCTHKLDEALRLVSSRTGAPDVLEEADRVPSEGSSAYE